MKVSDHHVRSPLLNINRACQTCHKFSEDELRSRVQNIQDRTFEMRNIALDALTDLIRDIKDARSKGMAEDLITSAQLYQRKAQFLADFIEAENSMGFHAPQEAARILTKSINYSRLGQRALGGPSARETTATAELLDAPMLLDLPSESLREKWIIGAAIGK
jgi:nitrite reductase (cytochrome c-552)